MSNYLTERYRALVPYVPGEQPKNMAGIIKLNTNESPYGVSEQAWQIARKKLRAMQLYPDPDYVELREAIAQVLNKRQGTADSGISPANIVVGNGSDEVLSLAFLAFCDEACPAVFCDITYGFYPVFAQYSRVPSVEVPLKEDFSVDIEALCSLGRRGERAMIVIANPNAPTGIALDLDDIRCILDANPGNVVVVDEAYVDFGARSVVALVGEYPNLLVTQTFSKSRSMAGARLGFGVAQEPLIGDLNTLRNSANPYNVNNATVALALGVLADDETVAANCADICATRAFTAEGLAAMGFEVLESATNFVFARHPHYTGEAVQRHLREQGILVRRFALPRIADYNRITIGTREQMAALLDALRALVED